MKSKWYAAAVLGIAVATSSAPAAAKKKPQMTALQVQQLQSKDYEASSGQAFAAVMTVLQDAGYRIQAADKDTGLITGVGTSSKKLTWMPFVGFGTSKKTPVVSAFIEELAPGVSRVRLNFVLAKIKANAYGGDLGDEQAILDAAIYQDAFEKIDQAVFIRQAMAAKAPSASPTSAPVPQAQTVETTAAVVDSPPQ